MKNIKFEPDWKRSKEQIWDNYFEEFTSNKQITKRSFSFRYLYATAAAAIILLFTLPNFYVKTVNVNRGERIIHTLPDGSTVSLNSESTLKYKPLVWFLGKSVQLSGEALFEVVKGKDFKVITSNGSVSVLGTSFNVYVREDDFSVTCYTGKVAVEAMSNSERVVLERNTKFASNKDGVFKTITSESFTKGNSWSENRFVFVSEDLSKVLNELERQYNIKVTVDRDLDYSYTGSFEKIPDPYEVLRIVTTPFDMKVSGNGKEFKITFED
ncbi:MAG: FecR domain-containing protein [Bacteroidales bacterium]|nr:FecR domain-containing protein [Bacteroidales bacterium]